LEKPEQIISHKLDTAVPNAIGYLQGGAFFANPPLFYKRSCGG
jgi:hypothetical protein